MSGSRLVGLSCWCQVRKRLCLRHFTLKMIILPRQAQDKHSKTSTVRTFLAGAFVVCSAYTWQQSRPRNNHTIRMSSFRSGVRATDRLPPQHPQHQLSTGHQQQQQHQQHQHQQQWPRPPSFILQLDPVPRLSTVSRVSSIAAVSVASSATREAIALQQESQREGLAIVYGADALLFKIPFKISMRTKRQPILSFSLQIQSTCRVYPDKLRTDRQKVHAEFARTDKLRTDRRGRLLV